VTNNGARPGKGDAQGVAIGAREKWKKKDGKGEERGEDSKKRYLKGEKTSMRLVTKTT